MRPDAKADAPGLVFEVPLDTQGGDNSREKWGARHRRQQREKKAVGLVCAAYHPGERTSLRGVLRAMADGGPLDVRVVRLYTGTRGCDPHNLGSRLKGIIDGLALVFGIDDGDKRIRYVPDQERAKMPGVRVEVSARKPEVQGPRWTAHDWMMVSLACQHAAKHKAGKAAEAFLRRSKQAEAIARALGGGG